MKRIIGLVLIALIGLVGKLYIGSKVVPDSNVIMVNSGDREMNGAMDRARQTLNQYWKNSDNRKSDQGSFSIKVKITDKNGIEHFWVNNVTRKGADFVGIIGNEPEKVKSVKFKQVYNFKSSDISDWMYMDNGKIYGGFSIRVLAERMPEKEGNKFKAILAYEPK